MYQSCRLTIGQMLRQRSTACLWVIDQVPADEAGAVFQTGAVPVHGARVG